MCSRFFLTVFLFGCVLSTVQAQQIDRLYSTLDSLIEKHDQITIEKEKRIDDIKNGVKGLSLSEEQEFDLNLKLHDEYVAFRFDSAYHYISKNLEMECTKNDMNKYAVSAVRMAHVLSVSGLFDRAGLLLEKIDETKLTEENKVKYYTQLIEFNLYKSEMAQNTPYFSEYVDKIQQLREHVLKIAPKDSYDYTFNCATYKVQADDYDGGIKLLEDYLPNLKMGTRDYSIVTSTLSFFYQVKQDAYKKEYYALLSAISDEMGAIRENSSLRVLAEILIEKGRNDEAYDYLFQAISDARFYGSRLRSMQVGRMAPQIMQIYDQERSTTQKRTYVLLIIISVISLILIAIMCYTFKLIKKEKAYGLEIQSMNEMLSRHNKEIKSINDQMRESNHIKDEYIGRFLRLSSTFIDKFDEYKKDLNRLAKDKKMSELYEMLKSQKQSQAYSQLFYENFDKAFLNIYPDFIDEVNMLMTDDKKLEVPKVQDKLTTELRILSLIRLDITDNQTIASILRSSITTIYTYRSKLKSRAINKDTFEDDVRKIGSF